MLIGLLIILVILILLICGNKGSKSIITTTLNCIILLLCVFLIYKGFNAFLVTLGTCLLSTSLILFYQNGINEKSKVAFVSTTVVLLLLMPLVFYLAYTSNSMGFNPEEYEITDSNGYTRNISLNMMTIQICILLISSLGALIDTSVTVVTSLWEIDDKHPNLSTKELLASGFSVGTAVLNTSMHTVFYIYLAEFFTLMMQYVDDFTFLAMINSKSFSQGFLALSCCAVGICLVLPLSMAISIGCLKEKKRVSKNPLMKKETKDD